MQCSSWYLIPFESDEQNIQMNAGSEPLAILVSSHTRLEVEAWHRAEPICPEVTMSRAKAGAQTAFCHLHYLSNPA